MELTGALGPTLKSIWSPLDTEYRNVFSGRKWMQMKVNYLKCHKETRSLLTDHK